VLQEAQAPRAESDEKASGQGGSAALGWEDYGYRQATDKATLERLNRLLDEALRDPFRGIRKTRGTPTHPGGLLVQAH
jgi:hypothetical protein